MAIEARLVRVRLGVERDASNRDASNSIPLIDAILTRKRNLTRTPNL